MASEFIENPRENFEKQDCEIKAFYRLAEKMKKMYPRLPMCLLLDSLYANKKVFEICKVKKWKYKIRFERGSIPTLAEDFEGLKKTTEVKKEGEEDTYIFFNDIEYNEYKQNVVEYTTPTCKCPFRLYIIN